MDAQIDPTLSVLLLGLGERRKAASQEARQSDGVGSLLRGNVACDLVIESRRCTERRGAVVGPVDPREGLLGGSDRRRDQSVTATLLHLIERGRILCAVEGGRRGNP